MKHGMINIAGAAEGRVARLASEILGENKGQSLIVVPTLNRAKRLAADLSFFNGLIGDEREILILPPDDDSLVQYEARSNDSLLQRMNILRKVTARRNGTNGSSDGAANDCIVIAPVTGAIRKLPPKQIFEDNTITIRRGEDLDVDTIRDKLRIMGYERVSMIEARGEYSMRGGIIDIFTPEGEYPYRVELFDTEVDSIRNFDMESQRSLDPLTEITVFQCSQIPRDSQAFAKASAKIRRAYDRHIKRLEKKAADKAREGSEGAGSGLGPSAVKTEQTHNLRQRRDQLIEYADGMINLQYMEKFLGYFYDETNYIWDYMDEPLIMVDDPARILETLDVFIKERADDMDALMTDGRAVSEDFADISGEPDYFGIYEIPERLGKDGYIFTPFVSTIKNAPFLTELRQINCRQMPVYNGHMDMLKADIEAYMSKDFNVTIVCSTEERMKNMQEFVEREEFNGRLTGPGRQTEGSVSVIQGSLTAGMEFTEEKVCYIWEGDVFGGSRQKRKRRTAKTKGQQIKSFADVQEGDYVVHESHGIGKFLGIEQLTVQGVLKDYLKVKYAGTDMLYIPVDQLGMLQKYIGSDSHAPKLNKLTGNEWKTTKAKAKAAVMDMAKDLIKLSADRMHEKGYAFSEDTVWQAEFEDGFPYVETDDQVRCIEEIKGDMERDIPMDRLLCGDVGFGKTEVAARALFKCVAEGKQAAVLVPTTLLANQHYYTLKDRFEKFPFKVEMLSRFRTAAQQKQILKGLEKGEIDLVIGTHRIISKDVKFKDLGLLVIDEEQRFGVRHKEQIKKMRKNIDVLTLSATPIPRTLHMSLSGIRDMSTIEEPPQDRYPVQTYVMEQDDFVIREAIEKEIARGGQVYILYNKVESINRVASDISRLVPDARVIVGHGKMREAELEDVIMEFAEGEADVMVSTTIIESGMDIPNANTMIVLEADHFGLAQLYQLRGRVGRSDRMAYTYLMYKKDKNLTEIAEKRLRAIRDFTEFGSGFRIAMKDLELRGAGNLLGTEQSGHMLDIGYELYCKLLEEAVRKIEAEEGGIPMGARAAVSGETAGALPGDMAGASDSGMPGAASSGRIGSTRRISEEEARYIRPAEEIGTDGEPMPAADETVFSLPISAIISRRYIDDEVLRLQMYKKIAMIASDEDESDVIDELLDRFGDIPRDTMNLIKISKLRTQAGRMGIKEISQQGLKIKLALWDNVRFAEGVIPRLALAYGGKVKFNGGANPYIRLTVGVTPEKPGYTKGILKELELFFQKASVPEN